MAPGVQDIRRETGEGVFSGIGYDEEVVYLGWAGRLFQLYWCKEAGCATFLQMYSWTATPVVGGWAVLDGADKCAGYSSGRAQANRRRTDPAYAVIHYINFSTVTSAI